MNAPPSDQPSPAPKNNPNKGDYGPTPSELISLLIQSLRHYCSAKRKASRWTDIAGVVINVAIAAAAIYSAWVFQGQLTASRKATNLTEQQWREQQRPWVGLSGNVTFPTQVKFYILPSTLRSTEIDLKAVFKIKNFSASPAFRTTPEIMLWLGDNNLKSIGAQYTMKAACQLADSEGDNGSVLFPGSEITFDNEVLGSRNVEFSAVRRVWVLGCVAYQDGAAKMHHMRFWIVSYMIPEDIKPTVLEQRGVRTILSVPIGGYNMLRTEAD